MPVTKESVIAALQQIELPDGGTLISRDMLRALSVEDGTVRFVIEAPSPEIARQMTALQRIAEQAVRAIDGVRDVSIVLTAHEAPKAPSLKIGGHPTPQAGPMKPAGVDRILAVASGKGGVGKSTVSSNLAVALAKALPTAAIVPLLAKDTLASPVASADWAIRGAASSPAPSTATALAELPRACASAEKVTTPSLMMLAVATAPLTS